MLKLFSRAILFICIAGGVCLPACSPRQETIQPALASPITFYDWSDDLPQEVLDIFQTETGVQVEYLTYDSQEAVLEELRQGKKVDVVALESRFVPMLAAEKLIVPLNFENIPNFKNISVSFRDLQYDPGNKYSIPFNYGVTGLLVRTDRVGRPITAWADLWDPNLAGHVGLWKNQPREIFALTMKSLGMSANSGTKTDLQAALARIEELKPNIVFLDDYDQELAAAAFAEGDVHIAMGYAGDLAACREIGLPVEFVYPEEGALVWGDTFLIPASSANRYTAEIFLNFLLRPDISAKITNHNSYATPNTPALSLVDPHLLSERAIFPTNEDLENAEIILPYSAEIQSLLVQLWQEWLEE